MSRLRLSILLFFYAVIGFQPTLRAADSATSASASPRCIALIIGGAPGDALHGRHFADWLNRFNSVLKPSVSKPDDLILLTSQGEVKSRTGDATGASIQTAISNLVMRVEPGDQFIMVLVGHGLADGSLALAGPDLSTATLAEALKPLKAKRQIVLDFSSSSGAIIPVLVQPGRILLTANTADQTSASEFAEFFLLALEAKPAGLAPSLLDLFNTATFEYAQWIAHQCQPSEAEGLTGWKVSGKRACALYRKLYSGDDVPESIRLASAADTEEDGELPLVPGENPDASFWTGRRIPNGTPMLEDTGRSDGAASLSEAGFKAITGTGGDGIGQLAKRTFLGKPEGIAP